MKIKLPAFLLAAIIFMQPLAVSAAPVTVRSAIVSNPCFNAYGFESDGYEINIHFPDESVVTLTDDYVFLMIDGTLEPAYQLSAENGVMLVPLTAVTNLINAEVTWIEESKTAVIQKDQKTVSVSVDSLNAAVDGDTVELDTPPRLINGVMYVPLRFIAEEAFGLRVGYTDKDTVWQGWGDSLPSVAWIEYPENYSGNEITMGDSAESVKETLNKGLDVVIASGEYYYNDSDSVHNDISLTKCAGDVSRYWIFVCGWATILADKYTGEFFHCFGSSDFYMVAPLDPEDFFHIIHAG